MAIKRDAADIAFSKVVRARDGQCLYCGKKETLEAAHIYGRRAVVTRWDTMNCVTLCHYHHRHFTENPVAFHEWLIEELGEVHMTILREKRNGILKGTKEVRREVAKHYREELRKIEADPSYRVISYI
jgi:hypothetical protein